MTRSCIAYSTDQGYLYPTLLSAIQARAAASPDRAEVTIVAIDLDAETGRLFGGICEREGIHLLSIPRARIDGMRSTFCRLFLDGLLPPDLDRILYVDGDTQIRGSLHDLLDAPLGAGQVMGAADPMAFIAAENRPGGAELRAYFAGLGFAPDQYGQYFNAGILYAGREGWARRSRDALRFFETRRDACRFLDQSALNAVYRDDLVPMSLRWNFPGFLMNCGLEAAIRPTIYHFMSNPRPWNGVFPPWNRSFVQPYAEMEARHPAMARFRPPFGLRKHLRYVLQQRYKQVMETATWRLTARRQAILDYERRVASGLLSAARPHQVVERAL